GFCLNLISVMAFLRVKELRTPSNILIFNLALADLSFSCDTLAYASYLRYWPFGSQGCQIHAFQGMISILATISFLCDVAWDRYHMYCTKQKMVWSTSLTLSTIMWSLAVFWAALTLPFIGWGVLDYEPMKVGCTLYYTTGDRICKTTCFFNKKATVWLFYKNSTLHISIYPCLFFDGLTLLMCSSINKHEIPVVNLKNYTSKSNKAFQQVLKRVSFFRCTTHENNSHMLLSA
uniref:G-protein coupled receptors family 1 profile domain-containing protein n=1 Tax=Electrophorus electricus TaxID=8005 RepID=A0A4W4GZ38_ELEEL